MHYEKRWILYNKVLPELAKKIGEVRISERILSPIPLDMEVIRAFGKRRLALDTEKGNAHTIAVMNSISSFLGDKINQDIKKWKEQKSNMIREPIINQIKNIEKEIKSLEQSTIIISHEIQELTRKPDRYFTYISMTLALITTYFLIIRTIISIEYRIELYLITSVVIIAMFAILFREKFQTQARKKEINMKMELEYLNEEINNLKNIHQKYKSVIDSNIENMYDNYTN